MIKVIRVLFLAAALMVLSSVPALAGSQDFLLVNNSDHTIIQVFCSPADVNDWEEDILEDGVIPPGGRGMIGFNSIESDRYWDIRIVFDNGAVFEHGDLDLFSISQITIDENGKVYAS